VLPTAAFSAQTSDLSAIFDASGSSDSDGTITSYDWNFGDGSTANGVTANKTYAAAGTYTVTLTATDNRGGTATTAKSVTATNPAPVKPSADNTGVPAGTGLRVHDGNLTITTPGTVIDGLDIRGYVVVKAANVTIKRSIIRGGPAATVNRAILSIVQAGASNYLVEDVTIVPANPTPYINGINVNQAGTIRRTDISGTVDGIMIYGSGVRVEDSYLHDFAHYLNDPNWNGGPSHDDAIQVQAGTGVTLVGNTLTGAYNAAVMVTQDAGATKDLTISGNWIDYGGCSVNFGSNGAYKTGMKVENNRFGRTQRNSGCAVIHNSTKSDLVPVGNVWDDNGQPAGIKKGS
jgi:PKD repeat protein